MELRIRKETMTVKLDDNKLYISYGLLCGVIIGVLYIANIGNKADSNGLKSDLRIEALEKNQNALEMQYRDDTKEIKEAIKDMSHNQTIIMQDVATMKGRLRIQK